MLNESTALEQMNAATVSLPRYPTGRFHGRGVVIPGGGVKYFPSAWVCIHMLRHVGCTLPIELWHLGPDEMSDEMKSLVEPLGVTCVDAIEVRKQHPVRTVGKANGGHEGWELKPYSILHSRFREVLFFDADNMPVVDPTFLFDTPQYQKCGSIFWPDPFYFAPQDRIWELTGVPYRHEPQFESGQILVDKERCWGPLNLAMWMNEHSDFWYRHMYGDKDTFHMAWRKLEIEYAAPEKTYERIQGVMCHHDFEGRRIFQHRHGHKWTVDTANIRIRSVLLHDEAISSIGQLKSNWRTRPNKPFEMSAASALEQRVAAQLTRGVWKCNKWTNRRFLFMEDGRLFDVSSRNYYAWNLKVASKRWSIHLIGWDRVEYLQFDEFDPTHSELELDNAIFRFRPSTELGRQHVFTTLLDQAFLFVRPGTIAKTLRFTPEGIILGGRPESELTWDVRMGPNHRWQLHVCGSTGENTCMEQCDEGYWKALGVNIGAIYRIGFPPPQDMARYPLAIPCKGQCNISIGGLIAHQAIFENDGSIYFGNRRLLRA